MAEKSRFSIFGFRIGKKDEDGNDQAVQPSFVPPSNEDGAYTVTSAAQFGTAAIDMDGSAKNEIELITRYREMAMQPEVESAIEDIVNEAIVRDDDGKSIEIVLDDLKQPDKIKKAISEEFDTVIKLLNYYNMGSDIFRRYYIDGRLFYHVVIDLQNPQKGIQELRYIDPRKIRKVREVRKQKDTTTGIEVVTQTTEYFVFSDKMTTGVASPMSSTVGGIKIAPDSIINVNSGLMDSRRGMILSYLHKAIKPLNQLRMIEDAVVIYRLSRAPERRVFYIDVGNLPRIKAEQYVRDIMTKYKNKLVYDGQTGEIRDDRRHLAMTEDFWMPRRCLSLNTKIKLLDGRDETLENLIKEYEGGKQNWTYSVAPDGSIVPGKISWAGITRKDAKIVRVELDNGEFIECTPDHKFILRDGSLCEAQNLNENQSLMPLYTRRKELSSKYSGIYGQVWNNKSGRWNFTHRLISNAVNGEKQINEVVHHVDFNRYNNNPENLRLMDKLEHFNLHSEQGTNAHKISDTEEWYKKLSESGKIFFKTERGEQRKKEISTFNLSDERIINGLEKGRNVIEKIRSSDKKNLSKDEYYKKWINLTPLLEHNEKTRVKKTSFDFDVIKEQIDKVFYSKVKREEIVSSIQKIYPEFKNLTLTKFLRTQGYKNLFEFLKENYGDEYKRGCNYNHKVISVTFLEKKQDTGTLTIDENHEIHGYHNFGLSCGIFVKNSDNKSTEITTLPAGQNLGQLDDVNYFEKKLYKSLNVPVSRLDPSQLPVSIGRSNEITRDELKFSKFVEKLRYKFAELFDQALRIQLVLKGICTEEEWKEFNEKISYDFIKDNNFAELKEAEMMQERLGVLAIVDQYAGKYYSKRWIQQHILRLNDQEIEEMEDEIQEEKQVDFHQQTEDQERQILLQKQASDFQEKVNPQQNQQVGGQEQGQEQEVEQPEEQEETAQQPVKRNTNPYNI